MGVDGRSHISGFERLCRALALLGGLVLLAMALLTVVSVLGRYLFGAPIPGDVELVAVLTATAVSLFLPYCQLRHGNVIVDVFTANAKPVVRGWLDTAGSLLLFAMAATLSWRLGVGGLDLARSGDESMMLRLPTWWGFVTVVPCFALTAAAALVTLRQHLVEAGGNR